MKLRGKTLAIVGLTMAVLFLLLFVAGRAALISEYAALEQRAAVDDVTRVVNVLADDTGQLDRTASDWAPRDATYRFMNGENPRFTSELNEESLAALGVDAIMFFSNDWRLVRADFVDLDLGTRTVPDEGVIRAVVGAKELRRPGDPRGNVFGVLKGPHGLMLVAARPITTADMYSPPNGTLVLARYLDDSEVEHIGAVATLPVAVFPLDGRRLPAEVRQARAALTATGMVWTRPLDGAHLDAYTMVRDVAGSPALIVRATLPRSQYTQGQTSILYMGLSLLVLGFAATGTVFGALDGTALLRIARLSREVELIGAGGDLHARVTVGGGDELAALAEDVNDMLEAIEVSEEELQAASSELERLVEERTSELSASEERYRTLIEHMADGVFSVGLDGRVVFANERAAEIAGIPAEDLAGTLFGDLMTHTSADDISHLLRGDVDPGGAWTMEVLFARSEASPLPVELRGAPLVDDECRVTGTQWIARDVEERKRYEQELVHMASHDHLTGLYNRRFFEAALELELAEARRTGCEGAIVWMDIDDFKDVNDMLGHRVGDEVLVALAEQLRKQVRESNVLARLGGDEFAVLIPDVDLDEARVAATRVLDAINSQTYSFDGHSVRVTASIGLVMYPGHGSTVEDLLANADVAMYFAKESGRSRVHVHRMDERWQEETQQRVWWNERIAAALTEQRFEVFAQPVLDLRTDLIVRHELLIRMRGEDGEMVPPMEFLPAAERLGLIRDIDRWMMHQATALLEKHGGEPVDLEINLSGKAFADHDLLPAVEEAIKRAGIDPGRLGFEITETAAIADVTRAQAFIRTLKELGCRFSLDDFGSGFSSFYYLKHLPIDCLKVDGSFIRGLPHSKKDQHLVRGIVEMCRGLGIQVAAEYVEDAETLQVIDDLGIDFAQGYHIGRPVPVDEAIETMLRQHGSRQTNE